MAPTNDFHSKAPEVFMAVVRVKFVFSLYTTIDKLKLLIFRTFCIDSKHEENGYEVITLR